MEIGINSNLGFRSSAVVGKFDKGKPIKPALLKPGRDVFSSPEIAELHARFLC